MFGTFPPHMERRNLSCCCFGFFNSGDWVATRSSLNMCPPTPLPVSQYLPHDLCMALPLLKCPPIAPVTERMPCISVCYYSPTNWCSNACNAMGGTVTEHRPNWQLAKILVKITRREGSDSNAQFVAKERENECSCDKFSSSGGEVLGDMVT